MTYLDAVVAGFANFVNFKGRAKRPEYWYFTLFSLLLGYGLMVVDRGVLGFSDGGTGFTPLYALFSLVNFLPALSVTVRRMHDIGRSGWWLLLMLTVVGVFIVLYWLCRKGDSISNAYGPPSTFGT